MSLLAKKIANLEAARHEVKTLETEIAEMLGLTVPKRSYTKRNLNEPGAENEPRAPKAPVNWKPANTTPQTERDEILRRLKDTNELVGDIAKSVNRSGSVIKSVGREAGINLRRRGQRIKNMALQSAVSPGSIDALENRILALRKSGKSQREIAAAIHRDSRVVRTILKKHGAARPLTAVTDDKRALIMKLLADGKLTKKEICKVANIGNTALYRLIREEKAKRE